MWANCWNELIPLVPLFLRPSESEWDQNYQLSWVFNLDNHVYIYIIDILHLGNKLLKCMHTCMNTHMQTI